MIIQIEINKCRQCAHIGHSGQFTPGGAKSICSHDEIVNVISEVKGLPRDGANDSGCDKMTKAWFWKNRVIENPDEEEGKGGIPYFCPMLNGRKY